MSIKSIVFDVGKVLFDYYPDKIVNAILPGNPLNPLYIDHLFLAQAWQDLDRGDITEDEAVEALLDIFPKKSHVKDDLYRLIQEFALHLDPMEDSIAMFNQLYGKYPLYILSNFQADPFDLLALQYPFLEKAKGQVVSAKVNMMKPEPEIYDYLLNTYSLTASETVFIDDRPENISSCDKKGIHGILYTSFQDVKTRLIELGVSV